MPYATPTAVHPLFASHPIRVTMSADIPISPLSTAPFDYHSNTFSTPLNGVPRSKSTGAKIRLAVPESVEPSSTSVHTTSGYRLTNLSSLDSKRNRGGGGGGGIKFTLAGPPSSTSSDSSDGEELPAQLTSSTLEPVATVEAPPKSPMMYEMGTLGRKRGGETMRHAAITEPIASPSSVSSTPSTIPFPSPSVLAPSPSMIAPPAAKRFHQAIVAGQTGVLRLNMDAIQRSRNPSQSSPSGPSSPPTASVSTKYNTIGPTFVRKKSGELVKPALRTASRPPSRASSIIESEDSDDDGDAARQQMSHAMLMYRRNSAPSTPTPKAVHFDSQLEHVKLFLAEQKPAAVSRDGSPHAYASTTEDEGIGYPWEGVNRRTAGGANKAEDMALMVNVADGARVNDVDQVANVMEKDLSVNVKLETLVAEGAVSGGPGGEAVTGARNLKGTILVRNLAFDKRVMARFTMDWWQTTSEVAARYMHPSARLPSHTSTSPSPSTPLPDPTRIGCDRFEFSVKLGDAMSKIEDKTLMLCLRFGVNDGNEWWDNNEGRNYRIGFEKKAVALPPMVKPKAKVVASLSPIAPVPLGAMSLKRAETFPSSPVNSLSSPQRQQRDREASPSGPRDQAGALPWKPRRDQIFDLRKELERAVNERLVEDDDDEDNVLVKTKKKAPTFRREGLPSLVVPRQGITIASNTSSPSLSPAPTGVSPSSENPPPPQLSDPLSTRYDFNASLRAASSWKPLALPSNHDGTLMFPSQKRKLQQIPFPSAKPGSPERTIDRPLGSPRDAPDAEEIATSPQMQQPKGTTGKSSGRHHDRSPSYFDGWVATVRKSTSAATMMSPMSGSVKLDDEEDDDEGTEKEQETGGLTNAHTSLNSTAIPTPTSSGASSPYHPMRYNSFPPVRPSPHSHLAPGMSAVLSVQQDSSHLSGLLSPLMGGSMASTPSATSASSPSPSHSPSSPPHALPLSPSADLNVSALLGLDGEAGTAARTKRMGMDDQNYSVFLNRFCFYTGDSGSNNVHPAITPSDTDMTVDGIMNPRRTQSESEVDNYFALRGSHHLNNNIAFGFGYNSPPMVGGGGGGSWGGMASGHTTPTGRSPGKNDKGVVTPRPGTPLGVGMAGLNLETNSLTAAAAAIAWATPIAR
ncbi:hypothetical protein FRB98_001995 [Tulasnella sp. 332]|nr:hypothetical protein FRB98_001995 [Tulasnella sp. 332]